MIRGFRDRRTERFAEGGQVAQFEPFRRQAEKRLRLLEAATSVNDLTQLPGNRLEGLKGDRRGQFSSASIGNGGSASLGRLERTARPT